MTLLFLLSLSILNATAQTFEDIIGTKNSDEIGVCTTIDVGWQPACGRANGYKHLYTAPAA